MFRSTMCPSSGETTVFLRHLVLVILCGWLSGCRVFYSTLHTRQSSIRSDKYQVSHRYNYFSWWWAHSRPKLVAKIIFFPNGRYIDWLSFTYANNKSKVLKLYYKHYNMTVLIVRSSHNNSNRKETSSVFHHFCPGLPVSLRTLSYWAVRYFVLDGFYSWVRGGCIAYSTGRGGFQFGEDVYPSSHAQRTFEILPLPLF